MAKTLQQITDKWKTRVSQSGQYYRDGVTSTTKSWSANAQAASARRNAGLQAAIADGRIDRGIQKAGDGKWRDNTINKGYQSWLTNTPAAAAQYQTAMQDVLNMMDSARNSIQSMPATTAEERIQRAAAFQLSMHNQAQAKK